jgi:hypothetical protein
VEWSIRREDLLEARPMEEVIAVEAARVREQMNARTPLLIVDLRTSATGERKRWQRRASRRTTAKGWSPPTLPSTSKTTANESRCFVHD